jgi:hypothetical protein
METAALDLAPERRSIMIETKVKNADAATSTDEALFASDRTQVTPGENGCRGCDQDERDHEKPFGLSRSSVRIQVGEGLYPGGHHCRDDRGDGG